jgi:hypothetical protein
VCVCVCVYVCVCARMYICMHVLLLLLGGVEQSVQSTAGIFWPIVHPHLRSNTPDSSISVLWLHQRYIAVTQGGGENYP